MHRVVRAAMSERAAQFLRGAPPGLRQDFISLPQVHHFVALLPPGPSEVLARLPEAVDVFALAPAQLLGLGGQVPNRPQLLPGLMELPLERGD
ncbi:MAG: hypothetical protein AB1635_01145 [Acidobacteriota bacterium]